MKVSFCLYGRILDTFQQPFQIKFCYVQTLGVWILDSSFVQKKEMAGVFVVIKAGVGAWTVEDDLCFPEILAGIEADTGGHSSASLAAGIAENCNILRIWRQGSFILDIFQLHTEERRVAAGVRGFRQKVIGGKFAVAGTAVMGDRQIPFSVAEIGTGIVEDAAVTSFDQGAFSGADLNALGSLPGDAVIIGIDGVVIYAFLDLLPVIILADLSTGRAEEPSGIGTVAQPDTVGAAMARTPNRMCCSVPMGLQSGCDFMNFLAEGVAVVVGDHPTAAGMDPLFGCTPDQFLPLLFQIRQLFGGILAKFILRNGISCEEKDGAIRDVVIYSAADVAAPAGQVGQLPDRTPAVSRLLYSADQSDLVSMIL